MKTIREICDSNFGGNWKLIETLEAREKERDAAEQERVKLVIHGMSHSERAKRLCDALYSPTEPEKFPSGYYWIRATKEIDWVGRNIRDDFIPPPGYEYRRGDDPPPEVTSKPELKSVCCDRYADNMACDCPKEHHHDRE